MAGTAFLPSFPSSSFPCFLRLFPQPPRWILLVYLGHLACCSSCRLQRKSQRTTDRPNWHWQYKSFEKCDCRLRRETDGTRNDRSAWKPVIKGELLPLSEPPPPLHKSCRYLPPPPLPLFLSRTKFHFLFSFRGRRSRRHAEGSA